MFNRSNSVLLMAVLSVPFSGFAADNSTSAPRRSSTNGSFRSQLGVKGDGSNRSNLGVRSDGSYRSNLGVNRTTRSASPTYRSGKHTPYLKQRAEQNATPRHTDPVQAMARLDEQNAMKAAQFNGVSPEILAQPEFQNYLRQQMAEARQDGRRGTTLYVQGSNGRLIQVRVPVMR